METLIAVGLMVGLLNGHAASAETSPPIEAGSVARPQVVAPSPVEKTSPKTKKNWRLDY